MSVRVLPVLAVALLLAGCGGGSEDCEPTASASASSPAEPPPVDVEGAESGLSSDAEMEAALAEVATVTQTLEEQVLREILLDTLKNSRIVAKVSGECDESGNQGSGGIECTVHYGDVDVTWEVNTYEGGGNAVQYDYLAVTGVLQADAVYGVFAEDLDADAKPRCDEIPDLTVVEAIEDTGYRCGYFKEAECGPPGWSTFSVAISGEGGIRFEPV